MDREYILCAAVRRKERRKSNGNPYHEGTNDIFHRFPDELDISPKAQGFYTSKGRFVNREEGYKIALEAGQLSNDRAFDDIKLLCSEDLY